MKGTAPFLTLAITTTCIYFRQKSIYICIHKIQLKQYNHLDEHQYSGYRLIILFVLGILYANILWYTCALLSNERIVSFCSVSNWSVVSTLSDIWLFFCVDVNTAVSHTL